MAGVKKMLNDNTIHVEEAKGDFESNYKYCSKEGDFFEYGKPKTGGKNIQTTIQEKIKLFQNTDRIEFIE